MISVIVPVYNVEAYLDECVQSILGQSYTDFELILVDDGSTDNSGNMCDVYSRADSRIVVIHKANGGLSDARNTGTKVARGEYVTYIDSDDLVSADYLESLTGIIKDFNVDMAVTRIKCFTDGETPVFKKSGTTIKTSNIDALERVLYQKGLDTSACALLIPVKIAVQNAFPVGKYHEDDFTTYKYYLNVNSVGISDCKQYFYRQRKGSIMHSFGKASLDELDAADNLVTAMQHVSNNLVEAAKSKKFSNYCQVLADSGRIDIVEPDIYKRISDYLKKERLSVLFNRNCRAKNKFAAAVCLFGIKSFVLISRLYLGK